MNKFEVALDRIKKSVFPCDKWTQEDIEHYKTVVEALEIASLQKWIPVAEQLPEKDGLYLVVACDEGCPYGEGIWYDTVVVTAEYYDDGRWVWYENGTEYDLCDIVTHWMPLPQPPKEGE